MDNQDDDLFYDRAELLKAMAAPEYASSPRYREQVATRLQRSLEAGRVGRITEEIVRNPIRQERIVANPGAGENGYIAPAAHSDWAEAGKVLTGVFKSPDEIAAAFSAPAFEIDPTYQSAVREKIARSIREGTITADLKAVGSARP